uniref:Putative signal peptide protein n=1 Tax=Ornithodoros turicata TaxID=34597 RepID=A0A2R5LKG3_9ACAR
MTSIERSCVTYFSNAITTEKQTESSSVNINDLKIHLTSAPKDIRSYIHASHRGDLSQFLSRYPEVFQVESGNRVFLTTDIINMHGIDNLEKMSVEYFSEKLRSMKAYQSSPIPVMALKRYLNDAPSGIQSFFSRHYFAKDFKRFFYSHPDIFGVSNSGNVYLIQDNQIFDTDDTNIPGMFSDASGIIESEVCQDEKDAVNFYRRVLNSPGIELQACSIDSLFAQLCEAPSNVQRFLQKNYNEVNFLDFFNAHKEVFNISMNGQTSLNDYSRPQTPPSPSEFPPLTGEADDISSFSGREQYWDNSQRSTKAMEPEQEAILFFQSVVETYALEGEVAYVEKLRDHLANAPLIVFSYFHNEYPYREFEKFFLNHASHFTIDSLGVVELARPNKLHERNVSEPERVTTPPWRPSPPTGSRQSSVESEHEDVTLSSQSRNLQYEAQLEKFYLDVFQVAYNYNVRVISPGTLLAISACLNRRLSGYLADQYGKDMTQFFQCYPNRFRVSKNGNICLAVEKDCHSETLSKKAAPELTAEFFVSVLQLLQSHQVKAVSPEILWEFLLLGPPKVNSFFTKHYEKDSCKAFFLKLPRLFAISKNKNVYLAAGSSNACGTDTSDDDSLEFVRASGDPCEVAAIEFFIDRVRSLKLSCYPIPLVMLRESLTKASPRVRSHFEEMYPQEKFLDFFVKYKDFFFVMQPINVVWLTRMDSDDVIDEDTPSHCPLSNKSKIFRQVIGVVVADLLLKSPRPFSTILGHLYSMVTQHGQELGKYPGKSNTERLCSLLTSCFNMFKIVKDNVILSWPVKHASSLILCLEEALAGVCVQIARHDTVSFSKFYTELRMKAERMFQCFIPDTTAMLDFLERREEFYVLNADQFIVIAVEVPDEQADEVSSLVEKELKARTDGVNLQLLLSSIREERFQHSFTCGTIMNVILKCKDKFYIDDNRLFLKEGPGCIESSQQDVESSPEPEVETSTGTGWITNIEEDGGTVAAALGRDSQYAIVNFSKSAMRDIGSGSIDLLVGDQVDFVATRKGADSEWVMVQITRNVNEKQPAKEVEIVETDSAEKAGSLPSLSCESSNEEDDGSSTNGEDRIFYSSASDVDPSVEVKNEKSEKCLSRGSSKEAFVGNHIGAEKEHDEESDTPCLQAYQTGAKTSSQSGSSVCSEEKWCSPSDMSQMATMLSLINTDEDETPYDRRIMNSMSSRGLERIKALLGNPPDNGSHASMTAAGDAEQPGEEKSNQVLVEADGEMDENSCIPNEDVKAVPSEDNSASDDKDDSCEAFEQEMEEWDGAGIWDVEPFVEAMEAQHMSILKDAVPPGSVDVSEDARPAEEDWEAEINDVTVSVAEAHDHGHDKLSMEGDTENVPKEEDAHSREGDAEASISDSNETLKSEFSREGSPVSRPSLAEELDLHTLGSLKNGSVSCSEIEYKHHSGSESPPTPHSGKDTQISCNGNESPASDLPEMDLTHSDVPVLPEEDDANPEISLDGGSGDSCAEISTNKHIIVEHESPLAPAAKNQPLTNGHGVDKTVPLFARVVEVDSSTLVLKISAKTLDEKVLWQCLHVGDQVAVQTLQDPTLNIPAAVLNTSAEISSVGTEVQADTREASAQTLSTGAILAANLLIE